MSEQERVLVDMAVTAGPDAVWDALRRPDQLRRWFGWDDEGLDDEIRLIFLEQATADDASRTLSWPDGDRIEVHAGDPTHLRVVRAGHTAEWDGVSDPVDEGWITFTQQLRFLLERHPDEDRRTVSALDVDLGDDATALLARLGLRDLGDEAVGSSYTVQRADGTAFSGEVFFQTDLQLGLTVEQEGDALLVVARTPPASAPPHGRAMFVLSLFSADDARAAEAQQRWTSWWGV